MLKSWSDRVCFLRHALLYFQNCAKKLCICSFLKQPDTRQEQRDKSDIKFRISPAHHIQNITKNAVHTLSRRNKKASNNIMTSSSTTFSSQRFPWNSVLEMVCMFEPDLSSKAYQRAVLGGDAMAFEPQSGDEESDGGVSDEEREDEGRSPVGSSTRQEQRNNNNTIVVARNSMAARDSVRAALRWHPQGDDLCFTSRWRDEDVDRRVSARTGRGGRASDGGDSPRSASEEVPCGGRISFTRLLSSHRCEPWGPPPVESALKRGLLPLAAEAPGDGGRPIYCLLPIAGLCAEADRPNAVLVPTSSPRPSSDADAIATYRAAIFEEPEPKAKQGQLFRLVATRDITAGEPVSIFPSRTSVEDDLLEGYFKAIRGNRSSVSPKRTLHSDESVFALIASRPEAALLLERLLVGTREASPPSAKLRRAFLYSARYDYHEDLSTTALFDTVADGPPALQTEQDVTIPLYNESSDSLEEDQDDTTKTTALAKRLLQTFQLLHSFCLSSTEHSPASTGHEVNNTNLALPDLHRLLSGVVKLLNDLQLLGLVHFVRGLASDLYKLSLILGKTPDEVRQWARVRYEAARLVEVDDDVERDTCAVERLRGFVHQPHTAAQLMQEQLVRDKDNCMGLSGIMREMDDGIYLR